MTPTQAERRADTERRLLDAAAAVFARRGYDGASVDEVATEAGRSTGALYARFGSKAGLFLALVEEGVGGWSNDYVEAAGRGADLTGSVSDVVDHWDEVLSARSEVVQLFIEFWAASMREPELVPPVAATYRRFRSEAAAVIEAAAAQAGVPLALPAEVLGAIFVALGDGLALQRLVDPGSVPPQWFAEALMQLLGVAPARPAAPAGAEPGG